MTKKILTIASIMAIVTSCSNDDLAVTQPDEFYSPISFGVESTNGEAKIITRADAHNHIAYNKDRDPLTMGVYGFCNVTDNETIFQNEEATYNAETTPKWSYANTKYWGEYAEGTDFDFFAYMPYNAGATLTVSGSSRTLSFPVTAEPISYNSKSGLICHAPVHKSVLGETIPFQMDQILTGLQLEFQLGTRMDMIREFKITKVELYGSFPTSGTVSRTYTKTGSTWEANAVAWADIKYTSKTGDDVIDIANRDEDKDGYPDNLIINQSATKTWGDPFYVIPDASFAPTIKVTYDVIVEGTTEVSRKGVESIIVFNRDNFSNYTSAGVTGKINPVKINIVPSYLYVLADSDQLQGYLVLE